MDWGYTNPHTFLAAVIEKVFLPDVTPFNRVWIYKEESGTKEDPATVALKLQGLEDLSKFIYVRCDPAMFHRQDDGSSSIVDDMRATLGDMLGSKFQPANNDRVGGWAVVHRWLSLAPDGIPYCVISNNCLNLLRTLPELVHDETNVEDVDTEGDDHWADALRYMLVHVKWIDARPRGAKAIDKSVLPTGHNVQEPYQSNLDLSEFEKPQKKYTRN
jgi:hypothetical protein